MRQLGGGLWSWCFAKLQAGCDCCACSPCWAFVPHQMASLAAVARLACSWLHSTTLRRPTSVVSQVWAPWILLPLCWCRLSLLVVCSHWPLCLIPQSCPGLRTLVGLNFRGCAHHQRPSSAAGLRRGLSFAKLSHALMLHPALACRMRETAVARVSDDFYPTDSASWTSHIPICSYNSLFMGALIQVSTIQERLKDLFTEVVSSAATPCSGRPIVRGTQEVRRWISSGLPQQSLQCLERQ